MSRPKSGGRKKGVPNKKSQSLRETLQTLSFDVPAETVRLYQDPNTDQTAKLKILQILFDRLYPCLKEQEQPVSPPPSPSQESTEDTDTLLKIVDG